MVEDNRPSGINPADRRSEERILVSVPVEITTVDGGGCLHTERTFIEDVSSLGCRFSVRGTVQQGDTVAVMPMGPHGKNIPGEKPRLFEIMWIAPKANGLTVGARLLQGEKLANAKFPADLSVAKQHVE